MVKELRDQCGDGHDWGVDGCVECRVIWTSVHRGSFGWVRVICDSSVG